MSSNNPNPGAVLPAPSSGVTVRMYNPGFGDCLLLAFRADDGSPRYLLIDCGAHHRYPNREVLLNKVAQNIADATGSHLHVVRLDTDRVRFTLAEYLTHLKSRYKVGTAKHYPAVWTWEAFQNLGYNGEGCQIAAKACEQVFSTPVFPRTTDDELQYIAWAMKQTLVDLQH